MDTKQRILDAAERLFAEHGFDRASLRAITAIAGVNLAAVNYHFKSKEALIQAVLARKLGPINHRRVALLDAAEVAAGTKPVSLAKIIRALVEPMVRPASETESGCMSFGTVMGRVYLERNAKIQRLLIAELQGVIRRFSASIHRALPGLPLEELYWRLFFTMGTVSHTLAAPGMLALISGGISDPCDSDRTLGRLMAYIVAGMKAPLPELKRGHDRRTGRTVPPGSAARSHISSQGGSPAPARG